MSAQTILTHYMIGPTRNLILGAGLGYAVQTENFWHVPIIIITPSVYAGYHLYTKKDDVIHWIRHTLK